MVQLRRNGSEKTGSIGKTRLPPCNCAQALSHLDVDEKVASCNLTHSLALIDFTQSLIDVRTDID